MDSGRLLAVALALLVGLQAVAGPAMADSTAEVSRAELADGSSVTRTLSYTFTPSDGEDTASVEATMYSSNVEFAFQHWEDLDDGDTGTSTTWNVSDGNEYRVVYEATVPSGTDAGYYGRYTSSSGSESEYLEVQVTAPEFGYIYTQEVDVVFQSEDAVTATKAVELSNTGDGLMKPTEVTFSGVPGGFSVDYSALPSEIAAGGSGAVQLEVTADPSVAQGTYEFEATVEDNLGNTVSFPVSVTVEKPPVLGLEGGGDEVNVGDVLVGSEQTFELTFREQGGYSGIDGVSSQVTRSDQYGSISFSGLPYVETAPGGSDTAEVTVEVNEHAAQHSNLDWTVYLEPTHDRGVGKEVTFTGRVIYPPRFGELKMSDVSMVFDEPKSEIATYSERVTVTIPNEGDQEMNVLDVSATTDSGQVSAEVVNYDRTVEGTSSGEATVQLRADPDTPEGSYSLDVTVEAEEAGRETVSSQIDISHDVALTVEKTSLEYGDVIVTKNLTRSTDVAETLEYQDVSDLSVTKVSGPDEWLTVVERPPETLTAGEAAPFVVALRFDTGAELYREYTWEYRISGEGIESRTITVTATPKPYSFDQIRDPLDEYAGAGDWRDETAAGMVTTLDTLQSELRDGNEVSRNDLTTSMAAGRATLLFIESVEDARETMSEEGNEAAQEEVLRAAATYNMLDSYVSELENDELRSAAEESRAAAEAQVDELVDEQTAYYRSQLDSEDVSMIERAHIKRQLAQLASLQGEEERAQRLRSESAEAFDRYSELVAEGNEKRQEARTGREEMRDSMLTVVAGQPLMVNPAKWDAFDRKSAAVLASYDEAVEALEEAGATGEADRVREERQQAAERLQLARYSMYGSTALYALAFLWLLAHLARNTYAYVRDAREAVTGDFLVAS